MTHSLPGAEPIAICSCCAQPSSRSLSGRAGWVVLIAPRQSLILCPECAELPESAAERRESGA